MKYMMNFTTDQDDVSRFSGPDELRAFYTRYGCTGLELMHMDENGLRLIRPDMVVGLHCSCISDWMNMNMDFLLSYYQKQLDYARELGAEYVVFHVTQVNDEEICTYKLQHTDEEVLTAACRLINALLDSHDYTFYFLMENLWWPGLNFLDSKMTRLLLDGIHYEKKGLMLDTGHYMHTDLNLRTQKEALISLHTMLDTHQDLLSYIKGIHLHQSLTGDYVKRWLSTPHTLSSDPQIRFCETFQHIYEIDRHLPFTDPGVRGLVDRIDPLYVTYEYITRNLEEHARYLEEGSRALLAGV